MSAGPRIVILAVNYQSDETAVEWLVGLNRALADRRAEAEVLVVDNTMRESSEEFFRQLRAADPGVRPLKSARNLGYFGGARLGWEDWRRGSRALPDWVVVSNVDVAFSPDEFFPRLLDSDYPKDVAVVAPSIVSRARRGDWNPKISTRPTAERMRFYTRLYRNHWLFNAYEQAAGLKYALQGIGRRGPARPSSETTSIYAPHGACLPFTRAYFERGGTLDYPGFLFGEEIFVAETARQLGLRILYDSRLRMTSRDHVSTGRFRSRQMTRYMYESAVLLNERYFQ